MENRRTAVVILTPLKERALKAPVTPARPESRRKQNIATGTRCDTSHTIWYVHYERSWGVKAMGNTQRKNHVRLLHA